MKKSFLGHDKALLTVMVQADTPQRIIELMDMSLPCGAEAFGMQIELLRAEHRKPEVYRKLFSYSGKPVYATNYRNKANTGKSDETIAEELVELSRCGATLCDVVGDLYDPRPDEMAASPAAAERQMSLIDRLHENGAEVIISSHVLKFTPAERVLEIALEQQRRGADISKIVVGAETMAEQIENLRIADMLKRELKIPFLFLSGGECDILRRIGGELGCCMYLCVQEYDEFAAPQQPLLEKVKAIRDNIK